MIDRKLFSPAPGEPALVRIDGPGHPLLAPAAELLWETFGPSGEIEPPAALAGFLEPDPCEPVCGQTYSAYVLIAAEAGGRVLGARAACLLVNPAVAPRLCVVYLANLVIVPEARGGALTDRLRDAPLAAAREYLAALAERGIIPSADAELLLLAEMELPSQADPDRLRRVRSYARAGFAALGCAYWHPGLPQGGGFDPPQPMMLIARAESGPLTSISAEKVRRILSLLRDDYSTATGEPALIQSIDRALARLPPEEVPLRPLPSKREELPEFISWLDERFG